MHELQYTHTGKQFNQNLRDHTSKTMAICLLRKPFNLPVLVLLIVFIVPSLAVTDCKYGKFWDGSACTECSPCPARLISSDIYQELPCYRLGGICPYWCSPRQADPRGETPAASSACYTNKYPPTTQSPAVPQVNVTITEPRYNLTANAYTVSCSASFRDMDIPTLKWYGPSGQLLASTDTSGKWKVTEGEVTEEVVTQGVVTQGVVSTTLLMKDFQEGDAGNYMCEAQGERSDNRTILLEYVEPPAITSTSSPTTQPSQPSIKPKPTAGESNTPKEGGLSTLWVIVIAVGVLAGVVLCAVCAFLILKQRFTRRGRTQRSIVTVADTEAHPLVTVNNLVERLFLETSDFKSATVKGIQACLDQPKCEAVIIKKNRKKIGIVRTGSNQDAFFIETLAWNDSIGVWMEYSHKNIFLLSWMKCFQRDNELLKTLKMKCLKIGNVAETSAHISCPSIENTFYMHFEEKNVPGGSSSAGAVELMCDGSREISDLRPSVTYSVQLGIKGQTGDSGGYNWVWKEEFTTRSITVQSVTPNDTSAKITLNEHSIPELYYEINQAKLKPMTSAEILIPSLIPGMEQVLQIKVKENVGGTTAYRLLQEKSFKTSGSVDGGGDYRGYATTDGPISEPEEEPGPSHPRRKKPSRTNVPTKCGTGLLEAIHTLRHSEKFKQVYYHTPQCVLEAVLDCLREFLKVHKNIIPKVKYVAKGKQRGMEAIEGFITHYDMQDYTGIFDLLKRFICYDKVHTQAGVFFAEQLLEAHCIDLRTCHVCKHAVYLLRWYVERQSSVDSRQSTVC
ncbi:uncharacterized protein LOC757164 isoform X2 [Strongylocentrotus purpuratus]|uniref:Ig-like domain-containing protein n=1 Tax=Strongylocentrotus purpuratus TaxID=7668 RepID=A0A7M7NHR1_STRPU|nr:uncharacterized protein LOC757164 isoform X2 [Strongylocentrotus purpuratus]